MGFHLFKSDRCLKIDGHKEETINKPLVTFEPDFVYIRAVDRGLNPLQGLPSVGDKVKRGTLLGKDERDSFPSYSPVSGEVASHENVFLADGHSYDCLKIKNDKEGTWETQTKFKSAEEATKEEILAHIKDSGIIGFGGAGFPTYRKYQLKADADCLIINAVECEPYLTSDYLLGISNMEKVFKIIPYLLKLSGAKKVYFAVKKDRPLLIEEAEATAASHPDIPFEVKALPDRYPMGYERNIVREIVHKEYDMLPIEAGAIVNNLSTYIGLGEYFSEGKVPVIKSITVSGEVNDPKTVLTPYGVLSDDLINFCGGAKNEKYKVICGGPMCGNAMDSSFALLLQGNGLVVMDNIQTLGDPCWHCGECCSQCPMDLQPVQIQMALVSNDIERMIALDADKCVGCGLCSYVCPSRIDVTQNVLKAKALVIKAKKERK